MKPDRISLLNAVSEFLRNTQKIGTIDQPGAWVESTQEVKIVYSTKSRQVVSFLPDLMMQLIAMISAFEDSRIGDE